LVILEGFCHSLADEKDSLEHVHSGLVDSSLKESRFPLRVTCIFSVVVDVVFGGQFFGVDAPLTPHLSASFQLQTEREASAFPAGSEGGSLQDTLLPLQGVKSGQRSNDVNCKLVGCAIGPCESMVDAGSCAAI
jgi:hypothetical protein